MNAYEIAERLKLSDALIKKALALPIPAEQELHFKTLLFQCFECFSEEASRLTDPNLLVLSLYLRLLPEVYVKYQKLGIPESVFWDSFQDFFLWSHHCLATTGQEGLSAWHWNSRSLKMEVFRLGRLQYEPRILKQEIRISNKVLPIGTTILEIHIPAGEPLSPEKVKASLKEAPPFFEDCFGQRYLDFHCHSWLLSPALTQLLPPESAILQFQRLFDIYAEDFSFAQAEERVFGAILPEPAAYPENTSLQRNLKNFLLAGNKVGRGMGILSEASR